MVTLDVPFEEAKEAITIRHLLTHTSGFTYPPQVLGVGDVAQQYDDIGLLSGASSTSRNLQIFFRRYHLSLIPVRLSITASASMFSAESSKK